MALLLNLVAIAAVGLWYFSKAPQAKRAPVISGIEQERRVSLLWEAVKADPEWQAQRAEILATARVNAEKRKRRGKA